nr:PREDICTED: uncharacterized membrane protein C3orf80 homolog isoform X2 [Lepisosteus oculatus]
MLHLSNDITPCFTFLTLFVIYACGARQICGGFLCRDDQRCCTQGNSTSERIICPRPRRHHERQEDDPSLLNGHTTASQDSLIDRFPEYSIGEFTSPVLQLPAYDEVKYLPTYEETMQVDRDRSDDHLLNSAESVSAGRRDERPDDTRVTRTSWNSV